MKNLGLLLSCVTLTAAPAIIVAQTAPPATAANAPAPLDLETSQNATINLIRLLVQQGVIPREAAVDLIRQAEAEARQARAQTAAVTAAADEIKLAAQAELKLNESDIRVTYVPEAVRQEIAVDVRNELAAAAPVKRAAEMPSWVSRLRPFGDFRLRSSQSTFYEDNAAIIDFNGINTGSPYDEQNALLAPPPTFNTTRDRDFVSLRARLGLEVDLADGYLFGLRLATGNNASPVSTNQTVGSPGSLQKYTVWLDQAFLRWESSPDQTLSGGVSVGRFPNPFFKTDITWDDDIQLDGAALHAAHRFGRQLTTTLTAGIFPIFNTALNFPANQTEKFESTDRTLSAVQLGTEYRIAKHIRLKAGLAYYYFEKIKARLSTPYIPLSASDAGDTDGRRPGFAQKGNTYTPLRSILADASNGFGTTNQWQYYGLASEFAPLAVTAQLDLNHYEPFQVSLFAEAVQNTAFDSEKIEAVATNNLENTPGGVRYTGGDLAWIAGLNVGWAALQERGEWRITLSYRYLESDSFIDGFVDSDFGQGGTNIEGFTFGGQFALSRRVVFGARWLSASEIDGPLFRNDLFQVDINAKF